MGPCFPGSLVIAGGNAPSYNIGPGAGPIVEPVQEVLVNSEETNGIDTTGVDQLIKLAEDLDKLNIRFCLAHVKGVVRDLMGVTGAVEVIGDENILESVQDGIDDFLEPGISPPLLG